MTAFGQEFHASEKLKYDEQLIDGWYRVQLMRWEFRKCPVCRLNDWGWPIQFHQNKITSLKKVSSMNHSSLEVNVIEAVIVERNWAG